jgi:DUF4097 and DUF4098 domain-containing protein YvlB
MRSRTLALVLAPLSAACNLGGSSTTYIGSFRLGHEAEREESHALELAPGELLSLASAFGSIEVRTGATPTLVATLSASGRTDEEAAAILARYSVVIVRGPEGPKVELRGEPLTVRDGGNEFVLSARASFVATVPPGTRLWADTGSGEVRVEGGLADCALETSFGSVTVRGARGDVRATSGSGGVVGANLEGGRLELTSSFGSVTLEDAAGTSVLLKSGSGDVRAERVRAPSIELTTTFGAVKARGLEGDARVSTGSGALDLSGVAGALVAKSDFGSVAVEGKLAELDVRSGSGDVRVRALAGSTNAGWSVRSSFGDVELRVPEGFGCELEARTGFGEVSSELPLVSEAASPKGKEKKQLRGRVGGGGAVVELESGSGDVRLRKQ